MAPARPRRGAASAASAAHTLRQCQEQAASPSRASCQPVLQLKAKERAGAGRRPRRLTRVRYETVRSSHREAPRAVPGSRRLTALDGVEVGDGGDRGGDRGEHGATGDQRADEVPAKCRRRVGMASASALGKHRLRLHVGKNSCMAGQPAVLSCNTVMPGCKIAWRSLEGGGDRRLGHQGVGHHGAHAADHARGDRRGDALLLLGAAGRNRGGAGGH